MRSPKKYARQYERADKATKTALLDALMATTGWTRDHARRAIRQAAARVGPAQARPRKPRPRKYSYDALVVLQEIWRLTGQPCGKYLVPRQATLALLMVAALRTTLRSRGSVAWVLRQMM